MRNTLLFIFIVALSGVSAGGDPVVQLFQEYIRINSTTNSNLGPAVEFWKKLANKEKVPITVQEFVPGYPVLVLYWPGSDSSLPSVMLNSHMDVVPADNEDGWKFPPFAAHVDDNGDIYGRGTQDTKFLAIQQFGALLRLKSKKVPLLRDVYMTLMPDEETGGNNGMRHFVKSKQFAAMNVGVEMDEGYAQLDPIAVTVLAKDKATWQFQVDCYGVAAHGSLLPPAHSTAIGQCLNLANQLSKFREEQAKIAGSDALSHTGDFTSVNLNILNGGSAVNTIPGQVSMTFDVRLAAKVDEKQFLAQLNQWISEAGDNITLTFLVKDKQTPTTVTDDSSPYWRALTAAASSMNITLNPVVNTGATDGKYLRAIGIPVFGLSPMLNTPPLNHKVNELLNVAMFIKGLDIYEEIVKNLANIPAQPTLKSYDVIRVG